MGMYTEFNIGIKLVENVPEHVINILKYMDDQCATIHTYSGRPEDLHRFFGTDRWRYLFCSDSFYFDGDTHTTFQKDDIDKQYHLTVRSNLKNYDKEIELFLDWIQPYIDTYGFLGYWRYEEYDMPTLIFNTEKGIEIFTPEDNHTRYRSLQELV